jgi:hypothetical protein
MGSSCLTLLVERPSDMESAVSFFQMVQTFDLQIVGGGILRVHAPYYQTEDWESLHQQLTQELLIRTKAFVCPLEAPFDLRLADPVLKDLSFGFHAFPEVIAEAVLKGRDAFVQTARRFVEDAVGGELLRTVLSFIDDDLNQSKAAKNLYMHRNTLLYRIDQFTQLCGIDPRRFEGAFAIKLLFR